MFGDQLGPHYLDAGDQAVVLVESRAVFRRRRFHRQKAHLILSAMRHRAAELGDQVEFFRTETYGEALERLGERVTVTQPTSFRADRFVREHPAVAEVLPDRGFATTREDFARWVEGRGRRRLLMEDFYRDNRRRHDVLMDGDEPAGGRWNLDAENREPPPRGAAKLDVEEPWWPQEDEIDEEVRADLDRWEKNGEMEFAGADGPRWFPATRAEAQAALRRFVADRLPTFGPYEDAMLAGDPTMAHSLLSPAMNLGLLHPLEIARAAQEAFEQGNAPLASTEGFVRQVLGWREYVWSLYWHLGPDYRKRNALHARTRVPKWFWELDADKVGARCLSTVLSGLRDHGWVHHIPRLMVLGNYAMQRGLHPAELVEWFHLSFVDGYDWVMLANVIGMSQWADGGLMATKPYAAGGAYIDRMSDFCKPCRYDPRKRTGDDACPFTAGYWSFLARNAEHFRGNQRMAQPLANLQRLSDVDAVVEQERARGARAP